MYKAEPARHLTNWNSRAGTATQTQALVGPVHLRSPLGIYLTGATIMGNTFKTAFLLTALTLLLMFIGRVFGGQNRMLIALVLAAVLNFVSYFFSDKLALAMYRAKPATRNDLPRAYQIIERLTQKIGKRAEGRCAWPVW